MVFCSPLVTSAFSSLLQVGYINRNISEKIPEYFKVDISPIQSSCNLLKFKRGSFKIIWLNNPCPVPYMWCPWIQAVCLGGGHAEDPSLLK